MRVLANTPAPFPIGCLTSVTVGRTTSVAIPASMARQSEAELIEGVYGLSCDRFTPPPPGFFRERAILTTRKVTRTFVPMILDQLPGQYTPTTGHPALKHRCQTGLWCNRMHAMVVQMLTCLRKLRPAKTSFCSRPTICGLFPCNNSRSRLRILLPLDSPSTQTFNVVYHEILLK